MHLAELRTAGPRIRPAAVGRSLGPPLIATALAGSALAIAAYLVSGRSLIPLAIPVALIGAYVAARQPTIAVTAILAVTGFEGTLTAMTSVPVNAGLNVMLAALWLGVIVSYLAGRRERVTWVWPGLIGICLYLAITVVAIFTSDSTAAGFESFRTSAFFMASSVLVALAPWSRRTYLMVARGILLVALAVGVYAVFRYIVGPSEGEAALAQANATALGLPESSGLRFFGSFGIANNLAVWGAALVPFGLAMTLGQPGRWRLIGLVAVLTCAFAVVVSEIRTGLAGCVAGAITVAALFSIARAFPSGRRVAGAVLAMIAAGVIGWAFYSLTVGASTEAASRYEQLLEDPSNDPAYSVRLRNWSYALDLAEKEPFGYGLGTQGSVGQRSDRSLVGPTNLDSSYLKVAIEQGIFVMVLLIAALLTLLMGLAVYAARVLDRTASMLSIGAAGALLSGLLLFYAGTYIEGLIIVPLWLIVGIGAAQPATQPRRAADAREP